MTKKSPYFHFSKSLSSTLGFTSERLLSNKRVRTNRTHMNLIFNHMMKFQNIHIPNSYWLVKIFNSSSITKSHFSTSRKTSINKLFFYFHISRAGKRRNNSLIAQSMSSKTQVQFQNLSKIHTAWHTERGKNNIHRPSIFHIRHFIFRKYS